MIKYPFQLLLAVILIFSFTSCDNEPLEGDFPVNNNPNPNPNVPGPPTAPGEGSTGDYWPTAVGNIWVYNTENADGSSNENDYEIISETSFDGVAAFELDEFFIDGQLGGIDDGGDMDFDFPGDFDLDIDFPEMQSTNYVLKNQGNYGFYNPGLEIEFQGIQTSISPISYVFFKDYLEAGESFSDSFTISITNSINLDSFEDAFGELFGDDFDLGLFDLGDMVTNYVIDYEVTVIDRDFEMTVNDQTFENVIHLSFETSITIVDDELDVNETITTVSEIYLAKDVGPIKIFYDDEEEGYDSEIISYELN